MIGQLETAALGDRSGERTGDIRAIRTRRAPAASGWCPHRSRSAATIETAIFAVRVTGSNRAKRCRSGFVLALEDISELVRAENLGLARSGAPHRARNKKPLTPIQLSAERLRRKYGKSITEDPAVFRRCTETIIRQVDDIKRMVDEFSQFARMPKAVIGREDVADTVRQVVFLQRVGNADIQIDADVAEDPMPARFDRRLIYQALTNIIKNATEADWGSAACRARARAHPPCRRFARAATSSSTWSTTASACRRKAAAACSSPM